MDSVRVDESVILRQEQVELLSTLFSGGAEAFRIEYRSDGLKVIGFIVKPIHIDGKAPALVYNRGGSEERGLLDTQSLTRLTRWTSQGYVVIASQYRGNDGGEGLDTFGGDDITDVTNLVSIAQKLPYVDSDRIGMFGISRGGLMTYLAIKNNLNLKCAAVLSGVSDLFDLYNHRGEVMKEILNRLVGNPSTHYEEYVRRSPIHWADEINVPLLILHGAEDTQAPVGQTRQFVKKLAELRKDHRYVEFPDGGHTLMKSNNRQCVAELTTFFGENLCMSPPS